MSRFKTLANSIRRKGGYSQKSANAIAASIGRKKYGKAAFQRMATAGRKRASR